MYTPGKHSITPVTAAVTAALYPGYAAVAQDNNQQGAALEEIVVTARKRVESMQDIPASIQAISQESLSAMGARNMEDFARFVPSINVVSKGAGISTVVFRGAITGAGYLGQATSSVYLDEISITQTGAQPSIRAVDIERVEALQGPQGTLYGSDAQAGTLRIITNQPVMNEFEAIIDGEVRGGGSSDPSYRGSLVFNVPLVEDTLAMRIVGFNDHDGGYIDNVYGHTPNWYGIGDRSDPDNNLAPSGWGTLDNSASVAERWNDADIYGGRLHLRWDMNDSWSATASYQHQTTDAGADNYYDSNVGDLQTVRFHRESFREEFDMASLKVEGDMGFANLVAAVSYYDRKYDELKDVTTYAHYWAAYYCHDTYYTQANPPAYAQPGAPYYWTNPDTGYIVWWPVYCMGTSIDGDFFQKTETPTRDRKTTAELRLSSQGDTFDWIVGLYREESVDAWKSNFGSPTLGGDGSVNMYQSSMSLNYWEWYFTNYYGTPTSFPNAEQQWHSESHTDWEQTAVFGEVSWRFSDDWELTLGGRYFERNSTGYYFVNHPGGPNFAGEPDRAAGQEIVDYRLANGGRPPARKDNEERFIPKVSLSYNVGEDSMIYGLYTRGARQGGVNRSRGEPFFPKTYDSDIMDNYEIGWKSTFAGGRGRFNATAYRMDWSDYQLELVDPTDPPCLDNLGNPLLPESQFNTPGVCGQPWQVLITNAGDAHINGFSASLDYVLNDNWVFGANAEHLDAQTDTTADLTGDGENDLVAGLRLPLVPELKGSAWLEYHAPVDMFGGEEFFIRTQWSYVGDSLNILDPRPVTHPNPQFTSPSYALGDLRFGLIAENWQFDVFVNNLTDERAVYTIEPELFQWVAAQTDEGRDHHEMRYVSRPREAGIRFMYRWGD